LPSLVLPSLAGEIHELREELSNPKMEKKKDAVKKVIAAMTVGKDVSMLFTDVVNCIQTVSLCCGACGGALRRSRALSVAARAPLNGHASCSESRFKRRRLLKVIGFWRGQPCSCEWRA
jgi:hypothetical protein